MIPTLYLIVPCYNEEEALALTSALFLGKLTGLIEKKAVSPESRILFVNDGSRDNTWAIIRRLAEESPYVKGISLSRNRGHQNAALAGLMEAKGQCDITITIDCDGQDDVDAIDKMVEAYENGCEIVYGIRSSRETDTFFKRNTAQGFYKLMNRMGAEVIYNHADYRLVSSRALEEFSHFKEVNLFLRGMFPLLGFKSACVSYERHERLAGKSHYPLRKMLSLAFNGITSLSIQPIRMITGLGLGVSLISFAGVAWSMITRLFGNYVGGWASMTAIICFLGGIQLICLGILGEYIGKIYLETKGRPNYIIDERI